MWPFHIVDINCTGSERTVWDCPMNHLTHIHSCRQTRDASVRCQGMFIQKLIARTGIKNNGHQNKDHGLMTSNCTTGNVRLVGGTNTHEGRVEVCINRVWGTVCYANRRYSYNYWSQEDGAVVCRQLGHQDRGIYTSFVHIFIHMLTTPLDLLHASFKSFIVRT